MKREVRAPLRALREGPVLLELAPMGRRRRQAIVLDANRPRAFLNLCRHLPVPLDALRGSVLDDSGEWLMCRTHGAKFRPSDGMCVEGPCRGLPLHVLGCRVDGEEVVVLDSEPDRRPLDGDGGGLDGDGGAEGGR